MMRLLLDTHILLWTVYKPSALKSNALVLLQAPLAEVYFSTASLWELTIKNSKYPGMFPPVAEMRKDFGSSGINEFVIASNVLPFLEKLPLFHKDPFDRLLIATAFVESMHLLTRDACFKQYDPASNFVVSC